MTEQEYTKGMQEIEESYKKTKDQFNSKYANEINKVSIGDIIGDNVSSIKVEKISFGFTYGIKFPMPCYIGTELTKKGELRKDGNRRLIYQNQISK